MLYHVTRGGQNYGPYTLEDLQRYVASGNVLLTDLAKSDEMADWAPVSQVLGASAPATLANYGVAPSGYAPGAVPYPDPPNLHWALVLVIGFFTCGLFALVWIFVQAAWVRKVDPRSKAILLYAAALVLYVCGLAAQIAMKVSETRGGMGSGLVAAFSLLWLLVYAAIFITAIFSMRRSIEDHFNGPEPIGLSLSGVMTFFFNVYYFQYHFTKINEMKRLARYRGAAI
jgi:hypothetical protein